MHFLRNLGQDRYALFVAPSSSICSFFFRLLFSFVPFSSFKPQNFYACSFVPLCVCACEDVDVCVYVRMCVSFRSSYLYFYFSFNLSGENINAVFQAIGDKLPKNQQAAAANDYVQIIPDHYADASGKKGCCK